jgi:hypothetical protein
MRGKAHGAQLLRAFEGALLDEFINNYSHFLTSLLPKRSYFDAF